VYVDSKRTRLYSSYCKVLQQPRYKYIILDRVIMLAKLERRIRLDFTSFKVGSEALSSACPSQ
jgi:hypothetical protein